MEIPYHNLLANLKRIFDFQGITSLRQWAPVVIIIGITAGIGSILFCMAIDWATKFFLGCGAGFTPPVPATIGDTVITDIGRRWAIPLVTTLGGLVSGLLVYKFAPEAEGHGTDTSIDAFHNKNGIIRKRVPFLKLVASAITIGSGGSAGKEGPVALISAGIGSSVARLFKLTAHQRRIAVAVGIGTGIGAIFKAPLGGAILSAEILYMHGFESGVIIPSFISTTIGYSIFASWQGFTPIFGEHTSLVFSSPTTLLSYAILGLLCGIIGILYVRTFYGVRNLFRKIKIPNYYKPAIGGLVTGLVGLILPQTLGMGYGWLQLSMDYGGIALSVMIALVFAKIVTTSFSIGSGGSGGVFAPGLVIGGMLAASLWTIGHNLGGIPLPATPAPFVIIGMMALFGAVAHAPVAVIIMVSEMAGSYTILPASMVAVGLAYLIIGKNTIYESQVPFFAQSPAHKYEFISPLLKEIPVKQAMLTRWNHIKPTASVEDACKMLEASRINLPVISMDRIVGIVAKEDTWQLPPSVRDATKVETIMSTDLITIGPTEMLEQALELMVNKSISTLLVVEPSNPTKLLGLVTRNSIIKAYESNARKMIGRVTST